MSSPPDLENTPRAYVIKQEPPSLLRAEKLELATTKNTTNCGIAHSSLDEKPDIMAVPQLSEVTKATAPLPVHNVSTSPTPLTMSAKFQLLKAISRLRMLTTNRIWLP